MEKSVLVEVYCGSVDDVVEAEIGGADRVELNSSLFLGGLTPSIGSLKEAKRRVDIPIMAMIRPRGGGFCYTDAEIAVMKEDTRLAIEHGADGIVFGMLNEDGSIDEENCKRIIDIVGDKEVVFHRAFDVVPDPFKAIDKLIELGVDRVLTKGQGNRIEAGIDLLAELIDYVDGRIEILPGGIKDFNYQYVIEKLGCDQVHISSFKTELDSSTHQFPDVYFGSALYPPEDRYQVVNRDGIKDMKDKVNKL